MKSSINAETNVIDRAGWNADDNILSSSGKYNFPSKIYVVLIKPSSAGNSADEIISDLYYYFSVRSGMGDLPFHYIIDSTGTVYRGNSDGDEAKVVLGDTSEAIFIGYLIDESGKINLGALMPLVDLMTSLANRYSINTDNIGIKNLKFITGERGSLTSTELSDVPQVSLDSFSSLLAEVKARYLPVPLAYKVEMVLTTIPEGEFEVGETVDVTIKVKNSGETNIYSGTKGSLYIGRNDPFDAESKFFVNDVWSSKSRVSLLPDGELFASGEEKEFIVKLAVPLYLPNVSEKFILIDPNNKAIEGSEFAITLKTKATEKTIIEIKETEIGYLNVREVAGNGQVIAKVVPGERYIVIEAQDGYYKINVNGKEGWVLGSYVKAVN